MTIADMLAAMSKMENRIRELESRAGLIVISPYEVVNATKTKPEKASKPKEGGESEAPKEPKAKKAPKEPKEGGESEAPKEPKVKKAPKEPKEEGEKKRGRKPSKDHDLTAILQDNETIVARIPLGDRKFQEYEVSYAEGKLTVLETGDSYDHPTTLVSTLAKTLEDCGERSSDCSKSMNGWMLCVATRDGKKVSLDKLIKKDSDSGSVASAGESTGESTA